MENKKQSEFLTIEKIKNRYVTFIKMNHLSSFGSYVNAYVYIDEIDITKNFEDEIPNCTYQNGNIVGIDTAQSFNEHQTYEQRYDSARRQITDVINFFNQEE